MFSESSNAIRRIPLAVTLVFLLAASHAPDAALGHSVAAAETGRARSTANPLTVSTVTSDLTGTPNSACTDLVFPAVMQSYFDPSSINPKAFSYQMADYDAPRNRVIFYPYGEISPSVAPSGVLLFYNLGGAFTNPASWTTVDLTQVLNSPNVVNFGGGFLDTDGRYAYLSAQLVNPNAVAVKIDLAAEDADPGNPNAYAVFEPNAPGALTCSGHKIGGFGGVSANGFAYFTPGAGIAMRYDSTEPFSSAGSWECFDLTTINDPNASKLYGMQSMAYVPPYVYYIPFSNNSDTTLASVLVRYDTTSDFMSASSYEVFDLASLGASLGASADVAAQLNGFTGAVVVGTRLVLVPWGLRNIKVTNSVALLYDTTRPLSNPDAWQYMDLRTVDPDAGGYQLGWLDRDGFVWFVPTHNYNDPTGIPPFISWNSNLPFTCIGAWHTYPNPRSIWSTGAAYDPATNTAWFAPYGAPPASGAVAPGLVTQFQVENWLQVRRHLTVSPGGAGSPPTISSFSASPVGGISPGERATLSWSVTSGSSLSIDNGVGDVTGQLSASVSPTTTTTYVLTASNSAGSATAAVTVSVETIASGWERSYRAGRIDASGNYFGGSEMLHLVAHNGMLFAAVDPWEDTACPYYGSTPPGNLWPQIMRLDAPTAGWQVDVEEGNHARIEILKEVTFTTDGSGKPLTNDVTLLLAAAFQGDGTAAGDTHLFTRTDATGQWTRTAILPYATSACDYSMRAMMVHRDTVTGVDRLLLSIGTLGVFSGVYDPSAEGLITWNTTSESGPVPARPLAIIEANGTAMFSSGSGIYQRTDGASPSWNKVVDDSGLPGATAITCSAPVGGIRGLTAIPNPTGSGDSLIFLWNPGTKTDQGLVIRHDPNGSGGYTRTQETAIAPLVTAFLDSAYPKTTCFFILGAYNFLLPVTDPITGEQDYMFGVQAAINTTTAPHWVNVQGGSIYSGGLYVIRSGPGSYRIAGVNATSNGAYPSTNPVLEATRCYALSPFGDGDIYLGGFDPDDTLVTNTAWAFRTSLSHALGH